MERHVWVEEFPGSVTVCDPEGKIVEMNDRAASAYEEQGGRRLVGSSLLDCHPEPSRTKLRELLERPRINAYTIEKSGSRKLIYQAPWYAGGRYGGLVEISLAIPDVMPHFVRDAAPKAGEGEGRGDG